ncbi:MAG TPA: MSMEG_4193 family putative phosphomutase [Actinomycetota bacterium]|nr:MSMEG_4193 family putative phosphomutase [Actinomycetota bacterium]
MTTLWLVRHGVTSHTGHRLSGWLPDVHLTDEGRAQAEAAAEMLSGMNLEAVYSSPIDRTRETAAAIAARHGLPVRTRRTIGEVEYGKWTNRSFKVLARQKAWAVLHRWPSSVRFPDGETLREVQSRALDEIDKIADAHPNAMVCVVSHADVIKLVLAHHLGVHIDLFQRIVIAPASVSGLHLTADGPRVLSMNVSPGLVARMA